MKKEKKISATYIYFFGAFGGILFGYDIGVMTGVLPFLQIDWHLTHNAAIIGWITSSVMLGAIFGGALAGTLSDKFGRRKMILISSIVFIAGSLLSAVAPNQGQYYLIIVRIGLGLAVGAASALVPSYMSEMAPANLRGRLSGINQVMIVIGMLSSYIVDYLLKNLPGTFTWRFMLGAASIPGLILFLGVLALPESPRFLVQINKIDEAKQVLSYIRKPNEVTNELNEILTTTKQTQQTQHTTSWRTLLTNKYRPLVIAGIGVAAFQQFQGANAIYYYIPLIVQKATVHAASDDLIWPIIQGIISLIGALLFLVIADKFN
ncbi:arabinose-proton symporter [Melissococcus plutonius ATCC 35311]|uniref:Arabinose-proton symporter n=1 Tax=Melissococcus plutonius (strain ATCC 35311 / DSM 29964 / CIP 104052 / LMG 20360 / NCIMB 702443) TaxID=940190 RepID=F3Y8V9_MELPT|nr:sugar porter (SP) family MFS transporter [Melissococcus plutonius]BAK20937.1 arabinose-proton symporter [Melissococcus plutonius ATCC 35311]